MEAPADANISGKYHQDIIWLKLHSQRIRYGFRFYDGILVGFQMVHWLNALSAASATLVHCKETILPVHRLSTATDARATHK